MFSILNNTLLIVSLLIAAIFLSPQLFGRTFVLPYIITSGSMAPAIPVGSAVLVAPSSQYLPGDIITFHPNGDKKTTVTHRLIFTEPRLITAGDANSGFDQLLLSPEHITGKVILNIPFIGFLADFAKTPKGFIFLVIVPATIIIYEELRSLINQIKKLKVRFFKPRNANLITSIAKSSYPPSSHHTSLLIVPVFFAAVITASVTLSYFLDTESSSGSSFSATPVTAPTP